MFVRNKMGALAVIALFTGLVTGCSFEKELARSSDVPAAEVRQQYEVTYDEVAGEVTAVAYFLRDTKRAAQEKTLFVEQQLILDGAASITVNGLPMGQVVCDAEACDKGYYEKKLKLPVKELVFVYTAEDGKKYRNQVDLPAAKLVTDLRAPVLRGKPFQLRFSAPAKAQWDVNLGALNFSDGVAMIAPEKKTFIELLREFEKDPSEDKAAALVANIAVGSAQEHAMTYDFSAEQTAKLPVGRNYLTANVQLRAPLQEATPAEGGFLRVRHRHPLVEVEVKNP